jgi:hypothetical protein
MRTIFLCLAAAALFACGGQNPSSGSDAGPTCKLVMTGAVNKTLTTCSITANYDGTNTSITLSTPVVANNVPEVTFGATIPGEVTLGQTYSGAGAKQQGATVYESATDSWTADSTKAKGSAEFTFTTLTNVVHNGTNKGYEPHGTASLTCTATSTSSGSVSISLTY